MARTVTREDGYIRELNEEEAWNLFDKAVQFYLHIPGEEFLARWEAGDYDDEVDRPEVMSVVMLLPFVHSE